MVSKVSNFDGEFLKSLKSDGTIGAGNFLGKLSGRLKDHSRVMILLDDEFLLPDGRAVSSLTLKDLILTTRKIAAWYKSNGIKSKDPVGLYLDDTIDYFLHYLSLTYIGAIPVMINGKLAENIAAQFMVNVGAVMVVSTDNKSNIIRCIFDALGASIKQKTLNDIDLSIPEWKEEYQHQPNDPVLLGHTSGTTGVPKAVQFNHYGFFFGVKEQLLDQVGERILSALPHSHASAISIMMSSMLRGARVKMQSKKDPIEIFSAFSEFKPDMFVSFPKIYVDMCRYDLNEFDLSSIGYWLSTGDANHEPHIKKLIEQGTHKRGGKTFDGSIFIDNLGTSEFGFAAFRNIHYPGSNTYNRLIGIPFGWVDAAVLCEKGEKKKANEIGLLGVKSPTVTAGYWNNTLLSERNRLAGYWLTGDLVYQDDRGFYYHVDRSTDPIPTVDGVLYSCQTEELILRNFPEIFDCSLVGVKHDNGFQSPVLSVETSDGESKSCLLDRINQSLSSNGDVKISKIIFESEDKYVGVTGKSLKRVMRDSIVV